MRIVLLLSVVVFSSVRLRVFEEKGLCLDGNYLKGAKLEGGATTGNGTEGGLFESWIRLETEVAPVNIRVQPTRAFVNVAPTPIGLGQKATITITVTPQPPSDKVFHGFQVKIKKPDGTEENKKFDSNNAGIGLVEYTPEIIGTYTIAFNYPGEEFTSAGVRYEACTLGPVNFTLQQDIIPPARGLEDLPRLLVNLRLERIPDPEILARITNAGIEREDLVKIENALTTPEITSLKVLAEAKPQDVMNTLRISKSEATKLINNAISLRG